MDNQQQPTKSTNSAMWIMAIIILIVLGVGVYFLFFQEKGTNTNNANIITNQNENVATDTNTISNVNVVANTNTVVNSNTNTTTNTNTAANINTNTVANLNTNVDMSGWKTYKNDTYKYSLKYPNDWKLEERSDLDFIVAADGSGPDEKYKTAGISIHCPGWRDGMPEGGGVFDIQYLKIKSEQFINAFNSDGDQNSQADSKVAKEVIDNVTFNHVVASTAIGLDWHFLIPVNNESYPFIIKYDQYDPIQNEILKTLDFE
jgi:preprotein translocase subunit YajC